MRSARGTGCGQPAGLSRARGRGRGRGRGRWTPGRAGRPRSAGGAGPGQRPGPDPVLRVPVGPEGSVRGSPVGSGRFWSVPVGRGCPRAGTEACEGCEARITDGGDRSDDVRVTLRDVAEQAGVSVATVSRALRRPEMVSQEAREKVLELSARLGYQPARNGPEMPHGTTGVLGVIVPDLLNPFYPALLKGAQSRAREHGVQLLLADAEEAPDGELPLVETLASQVDGILL